MPRVSILLTSYNHEKFISESIESILEQDFTDYELVIVDDNSSDDSWDIINDYAKKDSRIKPVLCREKWSRHFVRQCYSQMHGKYVAIAHSDDKWLQGKLSKQIAFLDENPKYAACFTKIQVIDDAGQPFNDSSHFYYNAFDMENRNRFEWLRYMFFSGNPFCHPSLMIRKEILLDEEVPPIGISAIPDFYRWINLALHSEIYVYPEKLACFRVRDNEANTSGESYDKRNRQAYELWHVLHLYKKLKKPSDLLAVFPEANAYQKNGELLINYALGRIFYDMGTTQMHKQLGLDMLLECLDKEPKMLEDLYDYSARDYHAEVGKQDLYGRIKPERLQTSYLYLDYGDGFSDEHYLANENYVLESGTFYVCFTLDKDSIPLALRFDPDKRLFRKYKIDKILLDGKSVPWTSGVVVSEDLWDFFYTTHAAYNIQTEGSPISHVEIFGETQPLSMHEVNLYNAQVSEEKGVLIDTAQSYETLASYTQNHRLKSIVKLILGKALPGIRDDIGKNKRK